MRQDRANRSLDRREFLAAAAATGVGLATGSLLQGAPDPASRKRPRIAAIFTELRFRSHSYNILENCFTPYLFQGKLVDPGIDIVSFYADQFPEGDLAKDVSRQLKVPLFPSIEKALCLGGNDLAVDGVLAIVEHGDYPDNELGQRMYPRKEFFDQSLAVMKRANRFVPYFNDKHLSYRSDWAKEMYDASRQHGFPLLAGSSVPLAQRIPPLNLPADFEPAEVVAVHGGGMEVYGYHGLEVVQSIVESRREGETGIAHVELLAGDAYQKAVRDQRWSKELFDAAMNAEADANFRRRPRPPRLQAALVKEPEEPHAIVVTYTDGLKATVLKSGRDSNRWNLAVRLKGNEKPQATAFTNGPWGNRCLFKALSHAIQSLFIERKTPYPVERTLLAGNATDAAMQSHHQGGKPYSSPFLKVAYSPVDFAAFRENGESWKLLTADSEEHQTFSPGDRQHLKGQ